MTIPSQSSVRLDLSSMNTPARALYGIPNLGATCYMSVVLQLLGSSTGLVNYFLLDNAQWHTLSKAANDNTLIKQFHYTSASESSSNKALTKSTSRSPLSSSLSIIPDVLSNLSSSLVNNKTTNNDNNKLIYQPGIFSHQIYDFLCTIYRMHQYANLSITEVESQLRAVSHKLLQMLALRSHRQLLLHEFNDTHEMLTGLLDALHIELKTSYTSHIDNAEFTKQIEKLSATEQSEKHWLHYIKNNDSIISQLFHFQQQSITTCYNCKHVVCKTEETHEIPVSIPDPSADTKWSKLLTNGNNNNNNSTKPMEFHSLLSQCSAAQNLPEYTCDKCKSTHELTTTQTTFRKLPPYLFVVLKRMRNNGEKITTPVSVDEYIDVSSISSDNSNGRKYRLIAVAEHLGVHYISYCYGKFRNHDGNISQQWVEFDDTKSIKVVEWNDVAQRLSTAYVMLYQRI
jgi:ubiquitin C-terminal hydrolase